MLPRGLHCGNSAHIAPYVVLCELKSPITIWSGRLHLSVRGGHSNSLAEGL